MALQNKLYPPIIEGKLKAFSSNGEKGIRIQFRQNPAVSLYEIAGFACQIKTLGGTTIGILKSYALPTLTGNMGEVVFNWSNPNLFNTPNMGDLTAHKDNEMRTVLIANDQYENDWPNRIYHDDEGTWKRADINPSIASQFPYYKPNGSGSYESVNPFDLKKDEEFISTGSIGALDDPSRAPNNIELNDIFANKLTLSEEQLSRAKNAEIISKLIYNNKYKVQLAYLSKIKDANGQYRLGYFSDVAIIKYIKEPEIYIQGFNEKEVNIMSHDFIGIVSSLQYSERLYSYRYVIEDSAHNIEYDSGTLIYDGMNDDVSIIDGAASITSKTFLSYLKDLPRQERFYVTYYATTSSGLELQSSAYTIKTGYAIGLKFRTQYVKLLAEPLIDSGCIKVSLDTTNHLLVKDETRYVGKFRILRTDNKSNFKEWEQVFNFSLNAEKLDRFLFNDGTVEQFTIYQYALQQYNDFGIISNKLLSQKVSVDYEDMYLSDADHILRISFNPAVSTFKPTILESKLETIGSKYPYMFRNGIVNYKEFALQGLISYLMDADHVFVPEEEDIIYNLLDKGPRLSTPSQIHTPNQEIVLTDLTGLNIYYERDFKLRVLNWLTNGKPKLLRSPTEGNYIVRLMGVNLSPENTLGRMLHNFSCSAYEIDELNMFNLKKYNLIKTHRTTPKDEYDLEDGVYTFPQIGENSARVNYGIINSRLCTMPSQGELEAAMRIPSNKINGYTNNLPQYLLNVRFRDFIPGSYIGVEFLSQETGEPYFVPILIGLGGSYNIVPTDYVMGIYPLWCPPARKYRAPTEDEPDGYFVYEPQPYAGTIYYQYENYFVDRTFDLIKKVSLSEEVIQGSGLPINDRETSYGNYFKVTEPINFFKFYQLQNLKRNIAAVHSMHIIRRDIVDCYLVGEYNLLPHVWNSISQEYEVEPRTQYFLCRTAFPKEYTKDSGATRPITYDEGKIPFFRHEILDNTIYKLHYNNEIYYLDGWLLNLALEDYSQNFLTARVENLALEYCVVNGIEWLLSCRISEDIENQQVVEFLNNEGSSLAQFTLDKNDWAITTYFDNTDSTYHIKQTLEQSLINGECVLHEEENPLYFDCKLAAGLMLDAVITIANIDYDLSNSGYANEWQQLLRWFDAVVTCAQANFNNASTERERTYWDYQMRHYFDILLTYLAWYLVEASIVNQPLMIPPFPAIGIPDIESRYHELKYDDPSIANSEREPVDDITLILDNSSYARLLFKDTLSSNTSYTTLEAGLYYASSALNITDYPDRGESISLAANSIFFKPYSNNTLIEFTPELLEAVTKAYGGSDSELDSGIENADLIEEFALSNDYHKISQSAAQNELNIRAEKADLNDVLIKNNWPHLRANTILYTHTTLPIVANVNEE